MYSKTSSGTFSKITSRNFSLRDRIDEQTRNLIDSCLRIGSIQDNLLSYFKDRAKTYNNPTVIESSYQLMDMERSRIRSVLYQLLVMLNMTEEALLLSNHWSKSHKN